jgi:hypothetical protein
VQESPGSQLKGGVQWTGPGYPDDLRLWQSWYWEQVAVIHYYRYRMCRFVLKKIS